MVFVRQKARSGANPESPPRTYPAKNIREVRTPSRTVFTQKHNELFVEQVLQCSQDVVGDELHFFVLGLNESSTEEDNKKSYRSLAHPFYPDKNQHLNCTDLMQMINQVKEELGDPLRNNDGMREQERVCMDAIREEQLVRMPQNYILFFLFFWSGLQ